MLSYISVLLTIFVVKFKIGVREITSLNQTINEKFKTKYELVNELSITEAHKKYIRFKSVIFEILEEASPIISNAISVALGGKKGSSGYREGG